MGILVKKQIDGIRKAEATFTRFLRTASEETERRLISEVQAKMRFDTGAEKKSVKSSRSGSVLRSSLTIYSDLIQAQVDEFGRRPGAKMPPFGNGSVLRDWVQRKINPEPKKLGGVTFLVARKIAKKGIRANHPFERTFNDNKSRVVQTIEAAITRAVTAINL